jgi:hypothetical protein
MKSNCITQALRRFLKGYSRPKGREVYLWIRKSRYRWSPFHVGWGERHEELDMLEMKSFKPKKPAEIPLHKAWKFIRFEGQVVSGDKHED